MSESYDRDDGLPERVGRLRRPESTYTDALVYFGGARACDTWAVFAAATEGDTAVLRALLERDRNLAVCNLDYDQPLHFAVRANQPDAVRLLLKYGANVLAESRLNDKNRCLRMAIERDFQEVFELLDADRREKFNYSPECVRLTDAIRHRDRESVLSILASDTTLAHTSDETGNHPIHWAVMTGQMAVIDILLDHGVNINLSRFDGARPLDLVDGDYWFRHQKTETQCEAPAETAVVAGFLLGRGASYTLIDAARYGDLGRMKELLASDPALLKVPQKYISWNVGSPLGFAASQGREDTMRLLLDSGADPNMREGNIAPSGSALYNAVVEKHEHLVKLLLDHGADPNAAVESCGNVIGGSEGRLREMVVTAGAVENASRQGFPDFSEACEKGDVSVVREMIGVHPELGRNLGNLQDAALAAQRGVVQVFVEMNPQLWNEMAVHDGDPETLRWMIGQGMNPNLSSWKSETPVHRAAAGNRYESLSILIESGGHVDVIEGFDESTPLGIAARAGFVESVQVLLDAGADPNLAGSDWARPLCHAERQGCPEVATLLRDAGAK